MRRSKRARSDSSSEEVINSPAKGLRWTFGVLAASVIVATLLFVFIQPNSSKERRSRRESSESPAQLGLADSEKSNDQNEPPSRYFTRGKLTLVWDKIKPAILAQVTPTASTSNIALDDYAGPDACVDCHKGNFADWQNHSHKAMNAVANEATVLGDFTSGAEISYLGGVGKFYRVGDKYRMSYTRGELRREYEITQTIGSRFYQYYVGRALEGPEPQGHEAYKVDQVLPFGYWLDRQTWVPIVHVSEENAEGERWESCLTLKPEASADGIQDVGVARGVFDSSVDVALTYSLACNYCHTTFPLGDMFVRMPERMGDTLPQRSLFELSDYVAKSHPEIWTGEKSTFDFSNEAIQDMTRTFIAYDARDKAATLGVSCEACHLGCAEHAKEPSHLPAFVPQSPELLTFANVPKSETGRNAANMNAICGRCHSGARPTYAGGISTWNSTEHADAMRGSCYSELTCVDCHNPHQGIGKKWPKTPEQDDESCLRCHEQFRVAEVRQLHTRHSAGSEGDRCMNCHMPKINEGMQDVVRTHTIFSPTQPDMIEANQPNACNLCHLDQSIDWTLKYLQQWYGKSYSDQKIAANYADRSQPVGIGWLKQEHAATRLTAVEAFGRSDAQWGIDSVAEMLDDTHLLNRQFAQTNLERLLRQRLNEAYGYWYYMTKEVRKAPVAAIQESLRKVRAPQ